MKLRKGVFELPFICQSFRPYGSITLQFALGGKSTLHILLNQNHLQDGGHLKLRAHIFYKECSDFVHNM